MLSAVGAVSVAVAACSNPDADRATSAADAIDVASETVELGPEVQIIVGGRQITAELAEQPDRPGSRRAAPGHSAPTTSTAWRRSRDCREP